MDELESLFTNKLAINTSQNTSNTLNTLNSIFIDEPITEERIVKLKEHLNLSIINHENEILKENTIKNAHIYCVIKNIASQIYGPLIEKYIRIKKNFIKNNASNCNGDCSKDNKNSEIKISLGGKQHNKFNWVQLRVSHDIQFYILTAYHLIGKNVDNGGELYNFNVPKIDMLPLILNYGGYAHGTNDKNGPITLEDLQNENNIKEYSLRPTYGDKCWNKIIKYRINETSL